MNCDRCLSLLNDFLDGELNSPDNIALTAHLNECSLCAVVHDDLTAILNCCHEVREHVEAPPNSQALWLRINNLIESEQAALAAQEAKQVKVAQASRMSGLMNRSWQFSFQQVASGVVGVAIISALLTVVGLQNRMPAGASTASAKVGLTGQFFGNVTEKPSAQRYDIEKRLSEQQIAIDYWNQRVAARKQQWNRNMRDAFDRNLQEIDMVVAEYKEQLQVNPHDDLTEEMLDSALSDKMELLREFAEL
jgi:hypothetical protein